MRARVRVRVRVNVRGAARMGVGRLRVRSSEPVTKLPSGKTAMLKMPRV